MIGEAMGTEPIFSSGLFRSKKIDLIILPIHSLTITVAPISNYQNIAAYQERHACLLSAMCMFLLNASASVSQWCFML